MKTPRDAHPDTGATSSSAKDRLLHYLAEERGVDLRDYQHDLLERILNGRIRASGAASVDDYIARLERDSGELNTLVESVVVPFTSFFRDPDVFDALKHVVLPSLHARRAGRGPLRAWCAGVATGEEAWSLAMLLADARGPGSETGFELLGSDREPTTLAIAAAGCYPVVAGADVPEPLRSRFLETRGDQIYVADEVRTNVRFAQHDLIGHALAPREAVVANFQLVLVRNVLIYFERRLRQKAVDRMRAVLTEGAALVLGCVETLPGANAHEFEPFPGTAPELRIFRYVGT